MKTTINDDFGPIKFIDTRGTGEIAFGIDKQLQETLRYESDGALFIRKYPQNNFSQNQEQANKLFDIIKELNCGEAAWVQFVANIDFDIVDNESRIVISTDFHNSNTLGEKHLGEGKTNPAIFNSNIDIINCANHTNNGINTVKELASRFVEYLALNIDKIDSKLEDDLEVKQAELEEQLNEICEIDTPKNIDEVKDNKIEFKINELRKKINSLKLEKYKTIDETDKVYLKFFDY